MNTVRNGMGAPGQPSPAARWLPLTAGYISVLPHIAQARHMPLCPTFSMQLAHLSTAHLFKCFTNLY